MCCVGTTLSLLALVAGMLLLAKSKKDELGMFFKIISYAVVAIALGCLVCCLSCDLGRMCGMGCGSKSECHEGMGMRGGDCSSMGMGHCKEGMEGCKGMEGGKCSMGMEGCKGMEGGKCKEMEGKCGGEGKANCCKGHGKGMEEDEKADSTHHH